MAFTTAGSLAQTTTASLTLTTQAAGDFVLVPCIAESSSVWLNGISGAGCTWSQQAVPFTGTHTAYTVTFWQGRVVTPGSNVTATLAFNGTTPAVRCIALPARSSWGSWTVDALGWVDSTGTASFPSLKPSAAGGLYLGYAFDSGSGSNGSTSGYTFGQDSNGNNYCYDTACTAAAQAPATGDTGNVLGIAVLLRETPPPPYVLLSTPKPFTPLAWQRQARPSQAPPMVTAADSGAAADSATAGPLVTSSDTGTGTDSGTFTVLAGDTGSGAESGAASAFPAADDTGHGADAGQARKLMTARWKTPDKLNKSGGTMAP